MNRMKDGVQELKVACSGSEVVAGCLGTRMIVRSPVTRIILFIMITRHLVSKMNPGHSETKVRCVFSRISHELLRAEILSVWRIKRWELNDFRHLRTKMLVKLR